MSGSTWFVYLLRCGDGTLYCGIALDVQARLVAHRAGKGAKYTRGRLPLELVFQEACGSKGEALRREREIKSMPRTRKLALCEFTAKRSSPSSSRRSDHAWPGRDPAP